VFVEPYTHSIIIALLTVPLLLLFRKPWLRYASFLLACLLVAMITAFGLVIHRYAIVFFPLVAISKGFWAGLLLEFVKRLVQSGKQERMDDFKSM